MRPFLKKILLFSLLLPILMIVFTIFWGLIMPNFVQDNIYHVRGDNSFMFKRVSEAKSSKPVDIVVIGASHAYRGIDPRNFAKVGLRLFNLGSSSQTPIQTNLLVKRYFSQLDAKCIIYEVYPEMLCVDGVESTIDLLSNDVIDADMLHIGWQTNSVRTLMSFIYGYFRQVFGLDKKFVSSPSINGDAYIQGGFVEKELAYFKAPIDTSRITWELNPLQLKSFSSLLDSFRKQGKVVFLVQAPISNYEQNKINNLQSFDSIFTNTGFPYFNFNRNMEWPDSLFYDSNHLNQRGVNVFNGLLLDSLQMVIQ